MDLLQSIQNLPKNEKLMIMEHLWKDLFEDYDESESPDRHKIALSETEKRFEDGNEELIDWSDAKRQLRKSLFE